MEVGLPHQSRFQDKVETVIFQEVQMPGNARTPNLRTPNLQTPNLFLQLGDGDLHPSVLSAQGVAAVVVEGKLRPHAFGFDAFGADTFFQ